MRVQWFMHAMASMLLSGCVLHCGSEETETEEDDGQTDDGNEGGKQEGAGHQGAGSQGGSGGGEPQEEDRLFVVTINGGVASYRDPATLDGTAAPATDLPAGADTLMYGPRDLAISSDGELFVACENGPSVNIYRDATGASGAVQPSRYLLGTSTELLAPIGLAVDAQDDTLYVVNSTSNGSIEGAILAFEGLSTLDGDMAPSRKVIVDTPAFAPLQIVEQDNRLFIAGQGDNTSVVYVFEGANTLDGTAAPDRILSNADWGQVLSIFVDDENRLFAVDGENVVFVYSDADTVNGNATPTAILEVPEAAQLSAVTIDRKGVMFLADSSNNNVMSFPNLGELAGEIQTSAATSFDGVGLLLPTRMLPYYLKR